MEKTLPKYVGIPLGVACFASSVVLIWIGIALVSGKTKIGANKS